MLCGLLGRDMIKHTHTHTFPHSRFCPARVLVVSIQAPRAPLLCVIYVLSMSPVLLTLHKHTHTHTDAVISAEHVAKFNVACKIVPTYPTIPTSDAILISSYMNALLLSSDR